MHGSMRLMRINDQFLMRLVAWISLKRSPLSLRPYILYIVVLPVKIPDSQSLVPGARCQAKGNNNNV